MPTSASILRRNHVNLSGKGERAMVFAHGFGCDQRLWRFVAPAFADEYRVVLFDYVGSGRSEMGSYDEGRYATLDGYVRDLIEVIDALGLKDVVLVGHSVSGMIGVLASIQRPELFGRLVLLCPSPRYLNDDSTGYVGGFTRQQVDGVFALMESNPTGWPGVLAPMAMQHPERPELEAELERTLRQMNPKVAREFTRATLRGDNRDDLAKVATPTLVLQTERDLIAPTQVGRFVHEHIAGSVFCQLAAVGHMPQVSAPLETVQAIRGYLQRS
jgi:sigma-B regulation protein RsbQ